jgi:hypothetical protein
MVIVVAGVSSGSPATNRRRKKGGGPDAAEKGEAWWLSELAGKRGDGVIRYQWRGDGAMFTW